MKWAIASLNVWPEKVNCLVCWNGHSFALREVNGGLNKAALEGENQNNSKQNQDSFPVAIHDHKPRSRRSVVEFVFLVLSKLISSYSPTSIIFINSSIGIPLIFTMSARSTPLIFAITAVNVVSYTAIENMIVV